MKIRCNEIVTPAGVIDGLVIVEDGKIAQIVPAAELKEEAWDEDWRGYKLLPGLIDIHTHGYYGYSALSTKPEDFHELSKQMAAVGVTSYLVTAGDHNETEMENLAAIAQAIGEQKQGLNGEARMLGIHMEGPFLNPNRRGAVQPEELLEPSVEKMRAYIEASQGQIQTMTMAPELDPQGELIRFCRSQNVLLSGGHTVATFAEYNRAIEQGLACSTHTGNAMRQMDRREPGAYGAALLSDQIFSEVICDLFHISQPMLEIMFRIKPMSRFIMISDSGPMSGLPAGVYTIRGHKRTISEAGLVLLEDGTIAGSSKNMLYGVRNLAEILLKPITEIVKMTSENPADLFSLPHKGSIAAGKDADLIVVDADFQLMKTFVEGRCAYQKGDVLTVNPDFLKTSVA